ncbi:MAG TPA: aminoacyl-tRNA hydrolase [Candidatus Saccharimonadales bacterium]|nr:aminoacyl-tRNA hydrolase [Candidatus Saccharimonadales bacterium]
MGLFQRQPQAGTTVQYYTVGQQRTVLLVGLGNVGREYEGTRHNIGFYCLDAFVRAQEALGAWVDKKDLSCHLVRGQLGETMVVAIKPTTLMNLSGKAVQAVSRFYKIAPENIIVIHDELDIPFGHIRLRVGGSAAGHNGIKSVTQAIGEAYGRVRIGVGPKRPAAVDSADFVLQRFTKDEQAQLPNLSKEVTAILTEYIYGGQLPHDTRSFLV